MSAPSDEWSELTADSPLCPWCGEEVTDSIHLDYPPSTEAISGSAMECENCGQSVVVERHLTVEYRAMKNPFGGTR